MRTHPTWRAAGAAIGIAAALTVAPEPAAANAERVCFHPFSGWAVFEGTVAAHQPAATAADRRAGAARLRAAAAAHARAGAKVHTARARHAAAPRPATRRALTRAITSARATSARVGAARRAMRALRERTHERYVVAVTGGRSGTGTLGADTYRHDTPCNYAHLTGRPLDHTARIRLVVPMRPALAVSSVSGRLPRPGASVTVTMSGLRDLTHAGIRAGQARAFAVWSR